MPASPRTHHQHGARPRDAASSRRPSSRGLRVPAHQIAPREHRTRRFQGQGFPRCSGARTGSVVLDKPPIDHGGQHDHHDHHRQPRPGRRPGPQRVHLARSQPSPSTPVDIEEFLALLDRPSRATRWPTRSTAFPATVEGRDQFRPAVRRFRRRGDQIEVPDVRFHQTDDPDVALVEERMVADLHGGGRYENRPGHPGHLPGRADRRTCSSTTARSPTRQLAVATRRSRRGVGSERPERPGRRCIGPGLTDVRMMTVAHTQLPPRAQARRSRPYDGVAAGDRRRASEIADHVELWLGLVHHHHSIEDELLWDRLVERVPGRARTTGPADGGPTRRTSPSSSRSARCSWRPWRESASIDGRYAVWPTTWPSLVAALCRAPRRRGDARAAD